MNRKEWIDEMNEQARQPMGRPTDIEKLAAARRFLHGRDAMGGERCNSCGIPCDRISRFSKATFNNYGRLYLFGQEGICAGCEGLLENPDLRFASIISAGRGFYSKVKRIDHAEILLTDAPCVVTWAETHKKHSWLNAGLSDQGVFLIGADESTIVYDAHAHSTVKDAIAGLLASNVFYSQIASGRYHPSVQSRLGSYLTDMEEIIHPHRARRLVDLLLYCSTKPSTKTATITQENSTMLQPEDRAAASLLYKLIAGSQYRIDHPMDFWDGYLDARVERVRMLPLPDAVDRLIGYLGVPPTRTQEVVKYLQELTPEQQKSIEKTIRDRARLTVAAAYTLHREAKETR